MQEKIHKKLYHTHILSLIAFRNKFYYKQMSIGNFITHLLSHVLVKNKF